ncbi:hypothetical protein TNCV_380041 [Trichonephila clavipes]|nr:hypothetical protein TNCV_380041 [Trichonephila clavipes]
MIFFFSAYTIFSSGDSSKSGHFSLKFLSHEGPSCHCFFTRVFTKHPLDGISAGFRIPRTNFQLEASDSLLISLTQLDTKLIHKPSLLIQYRTSIESLQKNDSIFSSFKSFFTESASLAPILHVSNSNRGMDSFFKGATLDLA